ncbi:MAG TPA: hypothetical protein VN345_16330 [Blastocatellia bacterium]|jgi:hypothetical protein|nr:hypothetical protein [Blastocatellia bacterium]
MHLTPELTGVLIGLGGAITGYLINAFVSLYKTRSEERKHYRELMMTVTINHWKTTTDLTREQGGGQIFPLDAYIVQMAKLSDIFLRKRTKTRDLERAFKEYDEVIDKIRAIKAHRTAELAARAQ